MSTIEVRLDEPGACRVVHPSSGAVILTDAPPEFGGRGRSFSSTDLLAAALGACIATNIDGIALRHGIPLDALCVRVNKMLHTTPKRLAKLAVTIDVDHELTSDVRDRLYRAAEGCVVHRALHPDVEFELHVEGRGGERSSALPPRVST